MCIFSFPDMRKRTKYHSNISTMNWGGPVGLSKREKVLKGGWKLFVGEDPDHSHSACFCLFSCRIESVTLHAMCCYMPLLPPLLRKWRGIKEHECRQTRSRLTTFGTQQWNHWHTDKCLREEFLIYLDLWGIKCPLSCTVSQAVAWMRLTT